MNRIVYFWVLGTFTLAQVWACQPQDQASTSRAETKIAAENRSTLPEAPDDTLENTSAPVSPSSSPVAVADANSEPAPEPEGQLPAEQTTETLQPQPTEEPHDPGDLQDLPAQLEEVPETTESNPDHSIWDGILKKYVSASGEVNYRSLQADRGRLDKYLNYLRENPLDPAWDRQVQLTYWINAYNAFTVDLILRNYPLKSIRDLDKPWDQKFIQLGVQRYSLNEIEHEIVRPQFKEPRIHFALVCAAASCPKLLNTAYRADILNQQLERQTRYFLNASGKNRLAKDQVVVSQLFNWYGEDFTTGGTLIDYLNRYSKIDISKDAQIEFAEYDWSLNE